MKRMLTLTLFGLLAISCSGGNRGAAYYSKGASMTHSVGTQAELDAANQRINNYKQELLQQGFHEVSVSFTDKTADTSYVNSKEEFVLEGPYRNLKGLRVTLWTTKRLEKDQPHLGGGVHASINGEQADRDFEELYQKVSFVVTGNTQ
ncbi:MAG TPA: hypothetical protein VKB05_09355 [Pyrinomonadaceae bacterium]|nr:hypothetical protein [Pyrinomonadaceae bacterium]